MIFNLEYTLIPASNFNCGMRLTIPLVLILCTHIGPCTYLPLESRAHKHHRILLLSYTAYPSSHTWHPKSRKRPKLLQIWNNNNIYTINNLGMYSAMKREAKTKKKYNKTFIWLVIRPAVHGPSIQRNNKTKSFLLFYYIACKMNVVLLSFLY